MKYTLFLVPAMALCFACGEGSPEKTSDKDSTSGPVGNSTGNTTTGVRGSYAYDAEFLKKHNRKVLELTGNNGSAKVLLSADYQGRVMTSSAKGDSGSSYGWINYDLIRSGAIKPHINPVGGEERFWLGPEGGQYSIYFKSKDSFNFNNWQVPPVIDTVSYDVAESSETSATFTKSARLKNYSGTIFDIEIKRKISLLDASMLRDKLRSEIDSSLSYVAYETDNSITNTGQFQWKQDKGLLSIWLLAMLTPSDDTKVIIPFENRPDAKNFITSDYFGPIPADRLVIKNNYLVLTCDGKSRGKIGLAPEIAKPVAGSFDFKRNILTITMFEVNKQGTYVNSKWELQKQPYKGDAVNAYNDGPLADGTQMGPFYEIESSSSAKELKPGESQVYKQSTFHFEGEYAKLEALALKVLGVKLSDLKK
ncbi:MAG: hypothetical protein EOO02_03600 [Chitinophagaceae bacterium]|nr:MAG: hypothetical protein EOO02_03600 [Chitinophagaceae bacterium]